jgi:TonB family protein
MSLRLEVPAQAILPMHTATPVHAIGRFGAQEPHGPARISGVVMAGQIVSKVNPVYPQEAREQGIGGTVLLHAIIDRDGTIKELTVISGPPMLVPSAMEAVKQWVYKPYLLNGEPTEVDTTITVNYLPGNTPPNAPQEPQANNTNEDVGRRIHDQLRSEIQQQLAGNFNKVAYQVGGPVGGVYQVGGSVRPPIAIYAPDPEYTEAARNAKLSGNVVVAMVVDQNGQPQNVRVARGLGNELDEKAVEAVQQYRFKPATRNGEPVPVDLKVEVNFQIY